MTSDIYELDYIHIERREQEVLKSFFKGLGITPIIVKNSMIAGNLRLLYLPKDVVWLLLVISSSHNQVNKEYPHLSVTECIHFLEHREKLSRTLEWLHTESNPEDITSSNEEVDQDLYDAYERYDAYMAAKEPIPKEVTTC